MALGAGFAGAQATRVWTGGGADNNWTSAANWGGVAPVAGDNLVFDATGVAARPTATNNFPAGTTFGSIIVAAAGYTINGTSVVLSNGLTANTYATGTSTVSLVMTGAAGVAMSADGGTLVLSAANTFTGNVQIDAGTVRGASSASAFGAAAGTINIGNGGAAVATLAGGAAGPFARAIVVTAGASGTRVITNTTTSTFSGAITVANELTIAQAASLTLSGGITGSGNIVAAGTGTAALTISANPLAHSGTFTNQGTGSGTVTISGGVAPSVTTVTQGSATSSLTISANAITVAPGGTTLISTAPRVFTISGGVTGAGHLVLENNSTLASGIRIQTAALDISGSVTNAGTGTGSVLISSVVGANVTAITQTSETSSLTVSGDVTVNGGLPAITSTANTSAILTLSGGTVGSGTLTLLNNGSVTGGITVSSGAADHAGSIVNAGTGTGTTILSAPLAANISGVTQNSATSPLRLSGVNTNYAGTTTLATGTLLLGSATSLGGGGSTTGTGGPLIIAPGATLDASTNVTITTTNAETWNGNFTLGASFNLNMGPGNVNVVPAALTITQGGIRDITFGGTVTGSTNLTADITSSGDLTLAGSVDIAGTFTNTGAGAGVMRITGGVSANVTAITESSTTSAFTISGNPVTVNPAGTALINALGTRILTVSGGIGGSGALILQNNSATASGITISTIAVANTGGIINSGTGTGSVVISGPVDAGVATMTQSSGSSALSLTGGTTGAGNIVLMNNGALTDGISISSSDAVDHAGLLTNAGTGSGSVAISSPLGANLTGVTQNSGPSALRLSGTNTSYAGTTTLAAGTLLLGSATSLGGNGSTTGTGGPLIIAAGTTLDASATTTISTTNAQTWQGSFTFGSTSTLNTGPGAITMAAPAITITNAGIRDVNFAGPVNGTTNVTTNVTSTGDIIFSGAFGVAGTVTNNGAGAGIASFTGGIAGGVTQITQTSTTSALTVSANPFTVHAAGTTLVNALGTRVLTISGGVNGAGNLILHNDSDLANGVTVSTNLVDLSGAISNTGTGTGNALLSAPLGSSVTSVTQNSATSTLRLSGANSDYAGATNVLSGTLALGSATALGGGGSATGTGGTLTFAAGTSLEAFATTTITTTNAIVLNGDLTWSSTIANLNTGPGPVTIVPATFQLLTTPTASRVLTIGGGVTGTSNVTVSANGTGGADITFAGLYDVAGTLTNAGTGSGTVTFSGGIGASVTSITANSVASGLNVTGPLAISGAGIVLRNANPAAATRLTVSGGVTGPGSIVLRNDSPQSTGVRITGALVVDIVGGISNIGAGPGSAQISAPIGSGVTGVLQNSAGSPLFLSGVNMYTAPTTIQAGVLSASSSEALGDGSATNAIVFTGGTLLADDTFTSPSTRPVVLAADGVIDATGESLTIDGPVAGAGGLSLVGGGTLALSGTTSIGGDLTIAAGTFIAPAASPFAVAGNWNNSGTFTHNGGTVTLNGATLRTIGGTSVTRFSNLVVNGPGVSLEVSARVDGTLMIANGRVKTNASKLTIGPAGTIVGVSPSRYVEGSLERFIPDGVDPSATFDIGDASAYTPVTVAFTGATTGNGSLTVSTTPGDHPDLAGSGLNALRSVNRYWTITNAGVAGFGSYDATFTFVAGDLDAGVTPSIFAVRKRDAGVWTEVMSDSKTATSIRATGMTSFSDFAVGERGFIADASTAFVPTSGVAGAAVNISVQLRDEIGRPAVGQTAVVTATVTGANAGATVTVTEVGTGGEYQVSYLAANAGVDTIAILVNGVPVSGSPFVITVSPPAPALALAITSSSSVPVVGDTVTITMTVSNAGTKAATNARVASVIPMARFTRLSLEVSHGTFDEETQTWLIDSLAAQGVATLTFRGIVKIPGSY